MKETAIPEALGAESFELEAQEGWLSWVSSVDHKQLGIMYLLGAFVFFVVAGVLALLMRVQLAVPNNHFLSPQVFNQFFTMHGTTMIFLVVVPMLVGFATYMVPLMIGARDMAFPRLNALSFWVQIFGGLMLYFSFATSGINGGAPAVGWFSYAPLSETAYSYGPGVNYWILGLLGIGVGTLVMIVNPILLGCYTLGCHSLRHLVGGRLDAISKAPARQTAAVCKERVIGENGSDSRHDGVRGLPHAVDLGARNFRGDPARLVSIARSRQHQAAIERQRGLERNQRAPLADPPGKGLVEPARLL